MSSLRSGPGPLLLVLLLLQPCQGRAHPDSRTAVYQRLRRLDEQFQQFQERTLARLEALGRSHNVSSGLEARLQTLTDQYHGLSHDLTHLRGTISQEMDSLREWSRKLQTKSKRVDGRSASLERNLRENSRQTKRHRQEQGQTLSNLSVELQNQQGELSSLQAQREELLGGLRGLRESLAEQDLRMSRLEGRVGQILQGNGVYTGVSGRTGDPLTSNLTPRDPDPPRNQTSRRERPGMRHTQPQSTKERGTKTGLQPPPSSQHPTEREDRPWGRESQGPRPGSPQQGAVSQFGTERREGGDVERGRGKERFESRREEEEEEDPEGRRSEKQPEWKTEGKKGQGRRAEEERREDPTIQNLLQLPLRHKIPQQHVPRKEATICNVDSMLLFPSASTENYVTFSQSLPNLPELSVCLWLRVDAGYVGTLLSYATEDNDNSLVLYGHNTTATRDTLDFVVGDPVYRRLPVDVVLDGRWHHLCFLWSSIEGRFWHYTDRRLTSTGSKFRKGFEVPGGGSVVLGQEQDTVGGGFDPAEGFVGRIAGFIVWDRVLSPGEVAGVVTGKGVPRGVVLTLEDVGGVHGEVQQVACECLEHCI